MKYHGKKWDFCYGVCKIGWCRAKGCDFSKLLLYVKIQTEVRPVPIPAKIGHLRRKRYISVGGPVS